MRVVLSSVFVGSVLITLFLYLLSMYLGLALTFWFAIILLFLTRERSWVHRSSKSETRFWTVMMGGLTLLIAFVPSPLAFGHSYPFLACNLSIVVSIGVNALNRVLTARGLTPSLTLAWDGDVPLPFFLAARSLQEDVPLLSSLLLCVAFM